METNREPFTVDGNTCGVVTNSRMCGPLRKDHTFFRSVWSFTKEDVYVSQGGRLSGEDCPPSGFRGWVDYRLLCFLTGVERIGT